MTDAPVLVWLRRDLRLADNPALAAACATGWPVIPLFIRDGSDDKLGAAPKWRLGESLGALAADLEAQGGRLILRSGDAAAVLDRILAETGAGSVFWSRGYTPDGMARDRAIKMRLKDRGLQARSFGGSLLFEPWTVETGAGGFYRVYSPYWKTVRDRHVDTPAPPPARISAPARWPRSETLPEWQMGRAMNRGAKVVAAHARIGEATAQARLAAFCDGPIDAYKESRDFPAADATSGMSEHLAWGEISPRQCWHAGHQAMVAGKAGAEHFLKELVWREFAYHLMYHTPEILRVPWRRDWDSFPWQRDPDHPDVQAWKRGRTGIRFVDAAMRELYVTGRMHNRARMIVASYLTKHLMTHWRIGQDWFAETLVDWDPASNAMGWQWTAGCGPDAAPYFRIFNPATQLEKFDRDGVYQRRWLAEPYPVPSASALQYFQAVPRHWALSPDAPYPYPIVALDEGRKRALAAYEGRRI